MKKVLGRNLYTMEEVGQLLGVLPATCRKYVKEGKLKASVIGKAQYVSESSLMEYLHLS